MYIINNIMDKINSLIYSKLRTDQIKNKIRNIRKKTEKIYNKSDSNDIKKIYKENLELNKNVNNLSKTYQDLLSQSLLGLFYTTQIDIVNKYRLNKENEYLSKEEVDLFKKGLKYSKEYLNEFSKESKRGKVFARSPVSKFSFNSEFLSTSSIL